MNKKEEFEVQRFKGFRNIPPDTKFISIDLSEKEEDDAGKFWLLHSIWDRYKEYSRKNAGHPTMIIMNPKEEYELMRYYYNGFFHGTTSIDSSIHVDPNGKKYVFGMKIFVSRDCNENEIILF